MSAPVESSTKKRTTETDSISQEDVEAKKRKLEREGKEEDVETEKRNNGEQEEEEDAEAEKRNNVKDEEEEDVEAEKSNLAKEEENNSIVLLPGANLYFTDPKAFFAEFGKDEKSAPMVKIPTLDRFKTPTIFHTRQLLPIREPGSKAVLSAAKVLLGISSSLGGEPLKRCSGFWIDFDEGSKTGTVLTTAHLIRTKGPPDSSDVWVDEAHYDSKANVD